MQNIDFFQKKYLNSEIKNSLINYNSVLSVTIAGSFLNNSKKNKASDIDVIVICKKLDLNIFNKCKKSINQINLKKVGLNNYKIQINDTFGPLKFNNKKKIIVHLMIYDVNSHIKHIIKSPFTCFDWQRSKNFSGVSLEKLCPINNLQLSDFTNARRSLKDYSHDIEKKNISYRKYIWIKHKPIEIKKNKKLDFKLQIEFYYHIINNSIDNHYKFIKQTNSKPNLNYKKKFLKKLDLEILNFYLKIRKYKLNQKYKNINHSKKLIIKFIASFSNIINEFQNKNTIITFIRHAKTSKNDKTFLGIGRNPKILPLKKKMLNSNKIYDTIFSSYLLRAKETAKIFKNENIKIILDKRLNEINYGKFESITYKRAKKLFPNITNKLDAGKSIAFPNGEDYKSVIKRLKSFIRYVIKKNIKKTLVVTHNVVLRVLIGLYYKIDQKYWHLIKIKHLKKIDFFIYNRKLIPNIDRKFLKNVIKVQTLNKIK